MTTKKPVSRRKPMGRRHEQILRFRCTEQQAWSIRRAAESEGLSVSSYVRQAALGRVRAASAQDAAPEMLALFKQWVKESR